MFLFGSFATSSLYHVVDQPKQDSKPSSSDKHKFVQLLNTDKCKKYVIILDKKNPINVNVWTLYTRVTKQIDLLGLPCFLQAIS